MLQLIVNCVIQFTPLDGAVQQSLLPLGLFPNSYSVHQKTTFNAQYGHKLYIDYILKSRFLANIISKKYNLMSLHRWLNPGLSDLI